MCSRSGNCCASTRHGVRSVLASNLPAGNLSTNHCSGPSPPCASAQGTSNHFAPDAHVAGGTCFSFRAAHDRATAIAAAVVCNDVTAAHQQLVNGTSGARRQSLDSSRLIARSISNQRTSLLSLAFAPLLKEHSRVMRRSLRAPSVNKRTLSGDGAMKDREYDLSICWLFATACTLNQWTFSRPLLFSPLLDPRACDRSRVRARSEPKPVQ